MKHVSLFTVPFLEAMDYPLTQQSDTKDASASKNKIEDSACRVRIILTC